MRVVSSDPVPPSREQPKLPRDLETICLKCLEKSPGRRYGSAGELADDLRRFLDGLPIRARSIGAMRRLVKWARRRPEMAALAGLLVVVGGAGLALLWGRYRDYEKTRETAATLAPRAREILHRYCYACHGQDVNHTEEGLNVLDHHLLLNDPRKLVVPGDVKGSGLIHRIEDNSMPPVEKEEYPRLSSDELEVLKQWVMGGAPRFPDQGHDGPAEVPTELSAEVKRIFREKCRECHQPLNAKKGISVLNHDLLVVKRKVVIPGDPEESLLYRLLLTKDAKKLMPPPDDAEPLTDQQIETIRRWILEGAAPFPRTPISPRTAVRGS
jgi:mono/diheme cytochrome c family protein